MSDQAILDKVRKLLRMANSNSPHEAAIAAARAQELIDRHKLGAVSAEEEAETQGPEEDPRVWEDPLMGATEAKQTWRKRLALYIARANECQVVRSSEGVIIIGTGERVELVRCLLAYVSREIDHLASRQRGNGRAYLSAYRIGCVDGVAETLQQERAKLVATVRAEAEARGSMALVAVETRLEAIKRASAAAEEAMRRAFPRLRTVYSSAGSNYSGRTQGRADGRQINLRPSGARRIGAGA